MTKKGKDILKEAKEEVEYYEELWESMSYDELKSMERSNCRYFWKGKELKTMFGIYISQRVIRDFIPIIVAVAMGSAIMELVKDSTKDIIHPRPRIRRRRRNDRRMD